MRMRQNGKLYLGLALFAFTMLLVLIGFFHPPHDPQKMNSAIRLMRPTLQHPLGTDEFGRDLLSRLLQGMGTTMKVALMTNVIGAGVGVLIGAFTGFYGGWTDEILMRINDAALSFPSILLALVFLAVWGTGTDRIMIAMGVIFIPSYARIVRSEFLKCRKADYVSAARLMGVSDARLIFVHILPNTSVTLLSSLMIGFNNAVLCEAAMSFLGIGVQPPEASLGLMLADSQAFLFSRPDYALFVGTAMLLLILSFVFLSEGWKEGRNA